MAKPTILPEWDETEVNSVEPDATHKSEGWLAPAGVPEKPPYQSFNFWQNSVWKWLNEINIKGLLGYDALTDYIADFSYTIGSDGNLYQCKINNGPASSIVNPVGDVTGTWADVINVTPPTARGYINGLILSNDADTDHDIEIAPGICRDSTDTVPISLLTALTKQIDVNWAEGNDDGGFPSGLTLLADTWYHFYIIMSADGTKVDAGFDTSLIATNLLADATNYSLYRRVGSVLTDGSPNILGFYQWGDQFYWASPLLDINVTSGDGNAHSLTMRTPLGVVTEVFMNVYNASSDILYISPLETNDLAPSTAGTTPLITLNSNNDDNDDYGHYSKVVTNTSSQIRVRQDNGNNLQMVVLGWVDKRGKDL